jgi:hypothetical protein
MTNDAHGPFMDEVPIEMAIFNIYVSLPQGIIYV